MRKLNFARVYVFLFGINQQLNNSRIWNIYCFHKEEKCLHNVLRHCLFDQHLPEHCPRKLRVAKNQGVVGRICDNSINCVFRSLPK